MNQTTTILVIVGVALLAILMFRRTTTPAATYPYSTYQGTTAGASTWGAIGQLVGGILPAVSSWGSGGTAESQYDTGGGGYDTSAAYNDNTTSLSGV